MTGRRNGASVPFRRDFANAGFQTRQNDQFANRQILPETPAVDETRSCVVDLETDGYHRFVTR